MESMVGKFSKAMDYIARALIVVIMLLVVSNVLLRKLGNPINGTSELVGFLTGIAISLALAKCGAQGGHVTISILTEKLPRKTRICFEIIVNMIVMVFLSFATWIMIISGKRSFISGEVGMTTEIPLFYITSIIALGFLSYFLVVLEKLISSIREVFKS